MPDRTPPAMLPGDTVLYASDIERMISAAAMTAARAVRDDAIKAGDVEEMVEEGIKRFLDKVGIDDIPAFRKDLTAMRAARETREALISHGLKAVVTVLLGGIGTAIWLAIKGAK